MSVVRAGLAEGFYFGEDAVLLALDVEGLNALLVALIHAQEEGSSRLDVDGTIHEFLIEGTASDIEFHDDDGTAVLRLSDAKAQEIQEIIELLTDMSQLPGRGHYYVDMFTPVGTLVISLNEYT
ncbi:hypothetical protein BN1232_04160 [Mycobacterium lentiflavum]|uniref:Uncharacterized protein n=1 Tax=Mycobacterium lentiflavum TaxID=141349 RepID=A0A0E4H0F2_MYCLN|nr:hypothetical protein [Mycobacterium lentiflavum]CQD18241.1 hypothetical protein BN1232_04160 [Mycobacterium lentiflavum]